MYRRVALHPALEPYVREILIQDSGANVAPADAPYCVLPKPYAVAGFQSRGRLEVVNESSTEMLARSGITGVQHVSRHYVAGPDTRSVLVIFEPTGAFPLLGRPLDGLTDTQVGLDAIFPPARVAEVEERLHEAGPVQDVSRIVQSFLLDLFRHSRREVHPAVAEAVARILQRRGTERIETVARDVYVGRRQLERLFKEQVGTSPKQFAALVQFDWAVQRLPNRLSWADLAYEGGYADQAHLARTFRARTGTSPTQYVRDPDAA